MKFKDLVKPIREFVWSVRYYLGQNMFAFTCIINAVLPASAMLIGVNINKDILPTYLGALVGIQVVTAYTKRLMENMGKGDDIPTPQTRFTTVDNDGEVTVEMDRVQELLLYVSDVEDYLHRKGRL